MLYEHTRVELYADIYIYKIQKQYYPSNACLVNRNVQRITGLQVFMPNQRSPADGKASALITQQPPRVHLHAQVVPGVLVKEHCILCHTPAYSAEKDPRGYLTHSQTSRSIMTQRNGRIYRSH